MFKRPVRVKSQSSIKKSERKQVLESISTSHPSLTTELIRDTFFPDGEDILCLKAETIPTVSGSGPTKNQHGSPSTFLIYCNTKKQPLFISFDLPVNNLTKTTYITNYVPTVYALWIIPTLSVLNFSTHLEVMSRLQKGAKLMLAGCSVVQEHEDILTKAEFEKDTVYAGVCIGPSRYPVGVGRILMSSEELKTRLQPDGERKGEVIEMVHFVGDELWTLGDKSAPPQDNYSGEDATVAGNEVVKTDTNEPDISEDSTTAAPAELKSERENTDNLLPVDPDALFRKVFLVTLKTKAVDGCLPMLASTLNRHMMDTCRRISDEPLEIKNTTYKKFGKFLDEMQQAGLITLVKMKEGVEAVSDVMWSHPDFKQVTALSPEPLADNAKTSLRIPASIRQVYIVNGKTAPLFQSANPEMGKGYQFRSTDAVREVVNQYIKTHNLASASDRSVVNLDKLLVDMLMNKTMKFEGVWPMKWGELFDKLLKEMSTNHEVVFTNCTSTELKGKFVPMDVKVEKKAGNKLVTVIRHLEGLGMDPYAISKEIQLVVGASVGVREVDQTNPGTCVTVQGDQTKLLDKFFFQTFEMPKKFVTGLEKPGKKG